MVDAVVAVVVLAGQKTQAAGPVAPLYWPAGHAFKEIDRATAKWTCEQTAPAHGLFRASRCTRARAAVRAGVASSACALCQGDACDGRRGCACRARCAVVAAHRNLVRSKATLCVWVGARQRSLSSSSPAKKSAAPLMIIAIYQSRGCQCSQRNTDSRRGSCVQSRWCCC